MPKSGEPATDLATVEPGEAARRAAALAMPAHPQRTMLDVIAEASRDPLVDVSKMKELLAMRREFEQDEQRIAFRAAKARLVPKLPRIGKGGKIIHGDKLISRYAKLEDIDRAIKPLLDAEGFSFSFDSKSDASGKEIVYSAVLEHRDGHTETKSITVARDTSGAKNAIQAVGSSTSYARRMLIKMHLNLIEEGEDDDGNGKSAEPITAENARQLAAMLADARGAGLSGFSDERWLKWLTVASFEELRESDFETVAAKIREHRTKAEAPPAKK